MRFRVLGPLTAARVEGGTVGDVNLGGPKQRAVLGMLLVAAGRPVSTDVIAEGVWGEDLPASVNASIHSYVSHLRAALGGGIERVSNSYRIDIEPGDIDAVAFERMLDEGRRLLATNPAKAAESLRVALALWRGRPYADLDHIPGLEQEVRRLEDLRLTAVEVRIDADLATGRHDAVIGELEALAVEYPLREGFRARHMLALYRAGRQAEALRAYRQTREVLVEELGVDPSPELQQLEERILAHDPALATPQAVVTQELAFLFTDLESSTLLWETRPEQMRRALTQHDELLAKAIEESGGRVFKHTGDGVLAVFADTPSAARAAIGAQRALGAAEWVGIDPLRVRMGIDAGEAESRGGDFFGPALNRAARIMASAHGGQIVLSSAADEALRNEAGIQILNLGEHRFKGLGAPQQVYQLVADGLEREFPRLRTDAAAPDAGRHFGDAIRGYEIRERVGAGRFGVVYRAYQPSVGREVAVKVIRPEFANHPEFVRRFEGEARMVAKLEHPHIVSLYDFWRDHEGAYLVMPYLVGRSLAGAPMGALPADRVVPILRQVGSALAYAHRQGVIHRDIKPANLLLDAEGNAYLADFGVAIRAVERASGIRPTSQVYRAPEDREGEALDARTDVYSLAAVAVELLTGVEPGLDSMNRLDPELAVVLDEAMAEDRAQRPASVDRFLDAFTTAAGEEVAAARPAPVAVRNPYKGLAAFDVGDARDFFGRDTEIAALTGLVAENRLVTVVGPSGSGKSSLVRAGLLPALDRDAIEGSDRWLVATMVPGGFPFDELATELGELATEPMGDIAAELRADDHGLMRITKRLLRDLDGELLVVIDQFEELYTLVGDDTRRDPFVDSIVAAVDDPKSRLRVVVTVRADFFDRPLSDDRLSDRVSSALLAVGVPGVDALTEIVERPAEVAGVRLDPGLSARLVGDVRSEPGALPLMQFVLSDLVERSTDGNVRLGDYQTAGGVVGAIGQRATEIYNTLSPEQQAIAEQVFLRLVTVSDDAADVRRRVRRSELESLGLDRADLDTVLAAYGTARLLTFDRDPITRGPTIEVAHEALLREWDLFRAWVTEHRDSLLTRRRFELAKDEWEAADRADDHLPVGGRLAQFEEWAADAAVSLAGEEKVFLDAAIERRERERAERHRRRRAIMSGFAAAALVAVVLAVAAWVQRGAAEENAMLADQEAARAVAAQTEAERSALLAADEARKAELEALRAEGHELAARSDSVRADDAELALLLAVEAIGRYRLADQSPSVEAVDALRLAIGTSRAIARFDGGRVVEAAGDGRTLATVLDDGTVRLIDWQTESESDLPDMPGLLAVDARFRVRGTELHVGYVTEDFSELVIHVWDIETMSYAADPLVRVEIPDGRVAIDASDDGALLALQLGNRIEVRDRRSDALLYEIDGDDIRLHDLFENGLVMSRGATLEVRDLKTGSLVGEPVPISLHPIDARVSGDGSRVVMSDDWSLSMVDIGAGQEAWTRTDLGRAFRPIWVDEDRVVVGGEAGLRVIDAQSGASLTDLTGHDGGSIHFEMIPGTTLIASAGNADGQILVSVTDHMRPEISAITSPIDVLELHVGDDGELIVNDWESHAVLDLQRGSATIRRVRGIDADTIPAGEEIMLQPVLSTDRSYVAGLDASGRSALWSIDQSGGQPVYVAAEGAFIRGVGPKGDLVALQRLNEPLMEVVNLHDETTVASVDAGTARFVHFSPDDEYVVTDNNLASGNRIRIWTTAGVQVASIAADSGLAGLGKAFSSDGSMLALAGPTGLVTVLDFGGLVEGRPLEDVVIQRIQAHDAWVLDVRFSPDGDLIASSSWNEPAKLWDIESGQRLSAFGTSDVTAIAFHPTEPWLYAAEGDTISVHTLDIDELIEIAESRLTRDMTDEECQQYLRRDCEGT